MGVFQYRGPFANVTVHIFEHSGHYPMLEEPAAFDLEVLVWLRRTGP